MRISTSQIFRQGVDAMLEKQREVSRTELQVATGKRILTPSDDPSAAVRILDLQESQKRLAQYQRNADVATAKLDQEETALQGMENLLQRVRELALQGNNDPTGAEGRSAIAAEVRQHIESFLQIANSQDANGEYIFAGFQSQTRPFSHDGIGGFSYSGDSGQRMLKIGDSREVAIGDPGNMLVGIGEVLNSLAANLEAGNGDPSALSDIDTALTGLLNTRAKIGARMNAIDDQKTANDAFELAVTKVRSSLEDLDYAEAISRFNQQLAALQASQQSFLKIQDMSLFN
ncbi:MAG: flagellar hook-associated protein FlgL, partial [Sedimenticolaceae bacterium]